MSLTQLSLVHLVGVAIACAAPRELPANGYLLFDVEAAAKQPEFAGLEIKSDAQAYGGAYVVAPATKTEHANRDEGAVPTGVEFSDGVAKSGGAQKAGGPQLRIEFNARSKGTVFVWVRANMPRSSQEYLAVQLDGGAFKTWWDHTVFPPLSRNRWVWHHADSYEVDAGMHTLTIARPMPGMGIDAIAISQNPAFCPKVAREGCIYLEAAALAPGRTGVFDFDVMGDLPVAVWCKVPRGATLGSVKVDGVAPATPASAPVAQDDWVWLPAGTIQAAGGGHRVEVPAGSPVATVAVCTKALFTPNDDPYCTGAVTITGVAIKPDREFKLHRGYRLDQVPGFTPPAHPVARSVYGGRTDKHGKQTGYFHTEKIDGRWTFVDPDGCVWFSMAVNHFGADSTLRPKMLKHYGTETKWANESADFLRAEGFDAVGYQEFNNTPTYKLQLKQRLPYYVNPCFMLSYARSLGFKAGAGNAGYRGDCIMPFDPGFAAFCEQQVAKLVAPIARDPFLIGYFLDNELPIPDNALVKLLAQPESDPGHQAAVKWLADHGLQRDPHDRYDEKVLAGFFDYMLSTYLETVIRAIRKVDPNHLICGIRANAPSEIHEQFLRTLGRYSDVISINYYMRWTPDPTLMSHWLEWSGKPVIISEWYAKGMDTRFDNVKNAGWVVKTQRDRGTFFQNFTLSLMQHPAMAGFVWFRLYDDNANSANKGILDDDFKPYPGLADAMRDINVNAYELLDYLKDHPLDSSHAAKMY